MLSGLVQFVTIRMQKEGGCSSSSGRCIHDLEARSGCGWVRITIGGLVQYTLSPLHSRRKAAVPTVAACCCIHDLGARFRSGCGLGEDYYRLFGLVCTFLSPFQYRKKEGAAPTVAA